jgi:hypothetical protein
MKVISDGLLSPLIANNVFQENTSQAFEPEKALFGQKGCAFQRTGSVLSIAPTSAASERMNLM